MSSTSLFNKYLQIISHLLPKPPLVSVVGFDIGTSSVKAVEMLCSEDTIEIKSWAHELIVGGDALTALKRLNSRLNVKDPIRVASVSGKGTLIRYVDMPRMSIEDLRKAFVYEADKYFPFDPQTIYTDCCILDPQSKEKKLSVLVVAAKKELVDERMHLFKETGIELNYVTTNAIATANAFERLIRDPNNTGARAILDIGGSISNLMILDQNNSPCFTRDIFVGSHDMSKQIANNLGVDITKADELKRNSGEREVEVIKACEDAIENLTGEVHLSFDYFMTEKNIKVSDLFLLGGGSLFKGLEGALGRSLNIPVKIWNPLTGLKLDPQVKSSEINAFSSQLGVAIGLALTKV